MLLHDASKQNLSTWLKNADNAFVSLKKNADVNALHDFRVNIRRIASYIRAYRKSIRVDERDYKTLKKLLKASNTSRDREVFLDWLRINETYFNEKYESLWRDWLKDELEKKLGEFRARTIKTVNHLWPKLHDNLQAMLRDSHGYEKISYPRLSDNTINKLGVQILQYLDKISSKDAGQESITNLHQLRLKLKRLRYLLEAATLYRDNSEVIDILKKWQDKLGEIHDIKQFETFLPPIAFSQAYADIRYLFENKTTRPEEVKRVLADGDMFVEFLLHVNQIALQRQARLIEEVYADIAKGEFSTLLNNLLTPSHLEAELPTT